jgi:hypothetical protein
MAVPARPAGRAAGGAEPQRGALARRAIEA